MNNTSIVQNLSTNKMLENRAEFVEDFLYHVFRLLPGSFRSSLDFGKIMEGAAEESDLDIQSALDVARYYFGRDHEKYQKYLGIIANIIITRYDIMTVIKPVEDVSDELYALYWHQMNQCKSRLILNQQDIPNYDPKNLGAIIYSHDLICMELGKTLLMKYSESNGLPLGIGEVSLAYTYIGNTISYVWILTQIQKVQEHEIDSELLDLIKRGEL